MILCAYNCSNKRTCLSMILKLVVLTPVAELQQVDFKVVIMFVIVDISLIMVIWQYLKILVNLIAQLIMF